MSGEDELKQMTKLYESGEYEKVKEIVDTVIERQPDDKRKHAKNLQKVEIMLIFFLFFSVHELHECIFLR